MGTKDIPPRYHPHFAIKRSSRCNCTQICNGDPPAHPTKIQTAAPGRRPGAVRKRFPPSRFLLERIISKRQPDQSLCISH